MGMLDKFKDLVGIEDIDDDDYVEEEQRNTSARMERKNVEPRNSYTKVGREKVVPMNRNTSPLKLVVIEPEGFEECPKLVDSLKNKRPVIINLEKIDSESARKICDFLSGATYALNGKVQKVTNNIIVFAPESVDIFASMENKEFDFAGSQKDSWR